MARRTLVECHGLWFTLFAQGRYLDVAVLCIGLRVRVALSFWGRSHSSTTVSVERATACGMHVACFQAAAETLPALAATASSCL